MIRLGEWQWNCLNIKSSITEAAKELEVDAGRLSKWRMDSRYKGGTLLPKNDKLSLQIAAK